MTASTARLGLAALALALAASASLSACFLGRVNDEAYGGHTTRENFVIEVPVTSDSLLVASAELAGEPRSFLVDTGAVTSLIDLKLARSLGLEERGTTPLSDFEGHISDHPVFIAPSLRLGDLEVVEVGMVGIDLGWVTDFECKQVAGLLGNNVLRHGALELDLGRGVIRLASSVDQLPAREGGITSALYPPSQIIQLAPPVAAGLMPRPFLIDTGASASIVVDRKVARRLPIGRRVTARAHKGGFRGVDKETTLDLFLWPDVPIGGLDLRGVPVSAGLGSNVLGTRVIRHFVVRVDDAAGTITFWPGEVPLPRGLRTLGVALEVAGDALKVRTLVSDSPATDAGIRWGDRVLAIDGAPVAAMSADARCVSARDLERHEEVQLSLEHDGAPYTATLRRRELFPEAAP